MAYVMVPGQLREMGLLRRQLRLPLAARVLQKNCSNRGESEVSPDKVSECVQRRWTGVVQPDKYLLQLSSSSTEA